MAEAVEASAALAWRLLATLEVGSILVATSALIAYTARVNLVTREKRHRTANNFLVTNSTNALGQELTRRLEAEGCTVRTHTSDATSVAEADKVDCLVVIGAESKAGLDGISRLVSEDVYENLNILESLAARVKDGGSIAWACVGDMSGAYADAATAFDDVIQGSLRHIAKKSHCEPIWVGRCSSAERAVDKILTKLLPCTTRQEHGFSISAIPDMAIPENSTSRGNKTKTKSTRTSNRNAAHKVSEYLSRWLKMVRE